MSPGREMDFLIATRVLPMNFRQGSDSAVGPIRSIADGDVPNYSSDIAPAWQVMEHLKANGFEITLTYGPQGAQIKRHGNLAPISTETIPHAICLAALSIFSVIDL